MKENTTNTSSEQSNLKVVTEEPNQVIETPVQEKEAPILITEDKVEIFKGDTFYQVDIKTFEVKEVVSEFNYFSVELIEVNGKQMPRHKCFSTLQLAEEFTTVKFTIQSKDVRLKKTAMNDTMAQAVVLMNVLGKPYWEELKKVFTVGEPTLSTINAVFE